MMSSACLANSCSGLIQMPLSLCAIHLFASARSVDAALILLMITPLPRTTRAIAMPACVRLRICLLHVITSHVSVLLLIRLPRECAWTLIRLSPIAVVLLHIHPTLPLPHPFLLLLLLLLPLHPPLPPLIARTNIVLTHVFKCTGVEMGYGF